jgi:uncharacterized protein YidB (DUF937 family)
MSELNDLNKKYGQKTSKIKDIKDLTKALEENKAVKATKQAVAGFKSQWSGLDDEGKVGMGKGTPGIYYNTVALPAIAGVVDEKYAPAFAVEADKKAGKIKEAVRKDMGIDEPKGVLEHFAYAGGEMLGQIPVPGALMNKIVGGAKKMGMAGKIAAAPIEYLSPTVDPRALNYGIGTTFGGTMGAAGEALSEEPVKKALGGLIQKYENGGKVGKVATFFSAVDKAINTLKQKKGTGEQILKQLETTPGVKPEELESRAIKRKLEKSPKITQEELQKLIAVNKPPIPRRIMLGAGIDRDWQPRLRQSLQEIFNEVGIRPTVNPETGKTLGFIHPENGEILSKKEILGLTPEELGLGSVNEESSSQFINLRKAVKEAQDQFDLALGDTNTKFEQYSQGKGKNNYREVLLQHTADDSLGNPAVVQRIDELLKSNPATEEEAAAINKEMDSLLDSLSRKRRQFNTSHWDDADVLAHYRVSDMKGPNGEKVLYVDEIQSDWHQQARDARKEEIKRLLDKEESSLNAKAVDLLKAAKGNADVTSENEQALNAIKNRLTRERKAELEKQVDENFGYSNPGDDDKVYKLNSEIERLRNTGMTLEEIEKYYTPGKIIPTGYQHGEKVLSFNSAENSPKYQKIYLEYYIRNMSIGVGEEIANRNARKNALEKVKGDWSVTTVEVDAYGNPRNGVTPKVHSSSPESYVIEDLRKEAAALERKKPDAPFKKNWHELAVKDILDLAANEGYDKVAFSPGIEQVKRYEQNLRKAVDEVIYQQMSGNDPSLIGVSGVKNGELVFSGKMRDGMFIDGPANGKTAQEVFGGEIAKQIEEGSAQEAKKIAGDNLTIGGEGMKSFYDQRLPSFVKNYAGKEFKAPTGYMEFEGPAKQKTWTPQEFRDEMNEIENQDNVELMEMVNDLTHTMAEEALARRGITPDSHGYYADWDEALWDEMDNHMDAANEQAVRALAQRNMEAKAAKVPKLKAFSVDVTPEMKEKITTQGQKLFAATPAIGLGAAQVPQQPAPAPEPAPEEQPQTSPEVPQAFQSGGKVGSMKNASEALLRVLHGSPTKVRLDREKNLDVTTDTSYAMKRARDKMEARGIEGPPMVNKFDIPAAKMLRFEEQYSPEDVAKMKRFYGKLPEGKAMTGEEIYEAAGGKDYVLEGLTRAGGFSGYQRPAGGSGGIGDWYRVTDQEALTRKARGGFIHGYADGGGKVDLTRRGLLGLRGIFAGPTQNLPAVIPKAPLAEIAKEAPTESRALAPIVAAPLAQLVQKVVETPMSRRDVLKRAGQAAINQALPTPKVTDVVEQISPLAQVAKATEAVKSAFTPNPAIDEYISTYLREMAEEAFMNVPAETSQSMWLLSREYLKDSLPEKVVKQIDKLAKTPKGVLVPGSAEKMSDERAEMLYDEMLSQIENLKPHQKLDVIENMYQMSGDPIETAKDMDSFLKNVGFDNPDIKQKDLEKYLSDMYDKEYPNRLK